MEWQVHQMFTREWCERTPLRMSVVVWLHSLHIQSCPSCDIKVPAEDQAFVRIEGAEVDGCLPLELGYLSVMPRV